MDPLNLIINALIDKFKTIDEFSFKSINIYCQGSSGAIMAAFFCARVQNACRILHVKKEGEKSHSDYSNLRPFSGDCINIIIDDFIASGRTVNRIHSFADVKIDCLIVSGESYMDKIEFKPDYLVCGVK